MIKNMSLIGSGNCATYFALSFKKKNILINNIFSRNKKTGTDLANKVNAEFINKIEDIKPTDLILVCVHDDEIENLIKLLPNVLIVHTSGSTSITVLKNKLTYGVIYPLQSLSKDLDNNNVPICIEGNSKKVEEKLIQLTRKISDKIYVLNSEKRKYLHLTAVIVSNFSNYLYSIAHEILQNENLDFNILHPLIQHTIDKNMKQNPYLNQTGPAKRGDLNTIKQHLNLLEDEDYRNLYELLSNNILKKYEK